MRRIALTFRATLAFGVLVLAASADDGPAAQAPRPPEIPEQAALRVRDAVARADAEALRALAARARPDPWRVVDELLRQAAGAEAAAFAKAAVGVDTAGLAAYVTTERMLPYDEEARRALREAFAAFQAKDFARALSVVEACRPRPATILAIRRDLLLGSACREVGRPEDSAEAFRRAGEAAETIGWIACASAAFSESGISAFGRHDYVAARNAWEREMSLAERRGDLVSLGRALTDSAMILRRFGEYEVALARLRRALAIDEQLGDRAGTAIDLSNLGNVYEDLGELDEALGLHRRALEIDESLGDRAGVAGDLHRIGSIHKQLGELALALEQYHRSLRLHTELGDAKGTATLHSALGGLYGELGARDLAIDHQLRAIAAFEGFGDRWSLGIAHTKLANVYRNAGNLARAREHHGIAWRIAEELGDRRGMALCLGNLGNAHLDLREFAEARACYERAQALAAELGDQATEAATHLSLAHVSERAGEPEAALLHARRGLEAARRIGLREVEVRCLWVQATCHAAAGRFAASLAAAREAAERVPRLVQGVSDLHAAATREAWAGLYRTGSRSAARVGDTEAFAWFLEAGRAMALLEGLAVRRAVSERDLPPDLATEETTARVREAEAAEALRRAVAAGDAEAAAAAGAALAVARESLERAVERIQREQKALASVAYPRPDAVATMASRLGPSEALVLYGLHEVEHHALVVTPTTQRIVALGSPAEVAAACQGLRAHDAGVDSAPGIAALKRLIADPIGLEPAVRRLLVSPDGILSYVPLVLLFPGLEIVHVPSGTVYGVLREEAPRRGEGVLALGDPDYGSRPPPDLAPVVAQVRGGVDLVRLPHTAAEAKAVGTRVLLGGEATEQGLREGLARGGRWRALHLACHGLLDPDRPMFSALALTPSGADDGFLTALDVFRMHVPADLAVLSACETGKGRVWQAEGIVGLTRAFLHAGAPRVLVSLWKVDDAATQALMARFYARWNEGVPAARALREAQAHVAEAPAWRHPRFWAAWCLWGLPE